jgi:uncharacterized protein YcbK (DUF882 family)
MSTVMFSRRQTLAALISAAGLASQARAGLIVQSNGPLIGRAPGPVVSLERPQSVPKEPTTPAEQTQDTVVAAQPRSDGALSIPLLNANTGDQITAVFEAAGQTVTARDKARLDWFFRDWRQNEIRSMDPDTLAILAGVVGAARRQGWDGEVRMHSGYRSRKTNDQLRSRGVGAARNSLHIQAKAIDFSFPGMGMEALHRLVGAEAQGGVGLYRTFVHIDSGPERRWRG